MHSNKPLEHKMTRKPKLKRDDAGRRDRQQARKFKRNWEGV